MHGVGDLREADLKAEGERRYANWSDRMKAAGFRRAPRVAFHQFLGLRARDAWKVHLPHDDHAQIWRKSHVGPVYTAHVYEHVREPQFAEMRAFCDRYGLQTFVSKDMDWYYPSRSTLIVIAKPQVMAALALAS